MLGLYNKILDNFLAVGYCQGFNMLAAIILEVMEGNVEDSLKVSARDCLLRDFTFLLLKKYFFILNFMYST